MKIALVVTGILAMGLILILALDRLFRLNGQKQGDDGSLESWADPTAESGAGDSGGED